MISDHYTVFFTHKKGCEKKEMVYATVRDYRHYNRQELLTLFQASDWQKFDVSVNTDDHWNMIFFYNCQYISNYVFDFYVSDKLEFVVYFTHSRSICTNKFFF